MKKYLVEGLGAFLLTFLVIVSLAGHFPVATPILAGLTLGLFVYTAGHISGAHINPAVTIGVWSLKKISTRDAVWYIVAQFIGALAALYLGKLFLAMGDLALPALHAGNNGGILVAEFLGTLVFTFGIAAVVHEKVPAAASGLVIGGSLLLGLSIASVGSNAILNPAVALGLGSFSWSYALAPVIGSLAGMQLYRWFNKS